jgi:Uma2 family endonuclease
MSVLTPLQSRLIEYPDDDGKPMANNSEQGKWIVMLYGNLCAVLCDVLEVYLAADHLWYPVEGHPEIRNAPDVMVVFGRKRGKRGSYKQWEEENVPVTVTFEILSPGNDPFEMADKLAFYDEYGVQEYYLFDPEQNRLAVYVRQGEALRRIWKVAGFVSPRLGIRFDLSGPEMVVFYPDGRRFRTFEELEADRVQAEKWAMDAEQRIENVQRRADRQAELMRRVLRQQATADELKELQQLLEQQPPSA